MPQRHFFATADDLLSLFRLVEKKHNICYLLTGLFDQQERTNFTTGSSLPTLRDTAKESSLMCPTYLVMLKNMDINVRSVVQTGGSVLYSVDQLLNPDSITFTHGGMFSHGVLISGRVATVSSTPTSRSLQSTFSNAIAKLFTRVNTFYVGPYALGLLHQGCRLTTAVQSPQEFDLEKPI